MHFPNMETERLFIRSTREADGPACLDIWLDDEMGRYMSDPPRDQADEDTLTFAKGIEEDEGWYPMVVFHKGSGAFMGTCSIVPADDGKRWDLGYALHKNYWRQGYGTELLSCLIRKGKKMGVCSFSAKVAQDNTASNALLRKLGFHVVSDQGSFRKRGTDIVYPEFSYLLYTDVM